MSSLQKATEPVYKEVYEKMLVPNEKNLPNNISQAIRAVCEGNYAFTYSQMDSYDITSCEIAEIPNAHFFLPVSIVISKSSPYYRIFTHQ